MNHLKTGNAFFAQGSYKAYKFLGNELQETGFYDMNARFFMPDLGIFGQYDPMSASTLDPYGYAYNNPIMFADPTGLEGEPVNGANSPGGPQSIGTVTNPIDVGEVVLNAPIRAMASSSASIMPSNCLVCNGGGGYNVNIKQPQNLPTIKTDLASIYDIDNRIGDQVLPAKETILGKILSAMSPREWEDSDGISYQVNSAGRITNIAPLMGDAPFGGSNTLGGYKMTSTAIRSALAGRIGKRGFLEVGYQFQKHFGRGGNWVIPQGVKQNPTMFNQAGYSTFKEIWRSPGSFQRVGGFIEKRLSDGRGIRLQENWKFKGFLD